MAEHNGSYDGLAQVDIRFAFTRKHQRGCAQLQQAKYGMVTPLTLPMPTATTTGDAADT
jgi:hypothetical protein